MKKKIVLLVTLALILTLSCTLLVACAGVEGKSAYELAVEQGFEGSLDEWLASLQGNSGLDGKDGRDGAVSIQVAYDAAVENDGFSGTYAQFLQEYFPAGDVQYASNLALLSAVKVVAKGSAVTSSMWGSSKRDVTSSGSGVIYRINKQAGDAYIITNYHVVYNANYTTGGISDDISVYLYGYESEEQAIPAKYIAGGYNYDIAILKVSGSEIIKNSDARAADVAESQDVAVGSTAIAVGCPSSGTNTDFSVTKGIVSVDSETISLADSTIGYTIDAIRVMRVDTTINAGNSGGGLYNALGQLIGIVNAKTSSTSIDNMGYAIPVDVAVGIANYAIANCDGEENKNIKKLYLGVSGVVNSTKAVYDSSTKTVRIVEEIAVGSIEEGALAQHYLLEGDILNAIEIDGVKYDITRSFSLPDILWKVTSATTSITFYVTRDGEETSEYIPISASNFVALK